MKVIIAGTRDLRDAYSWVAATMLVARLTKGITPTEIVSGRSGRVDRAGEDWAAAMGLPVKPFPADWDYGRKAGPLRNQQMANYADALVALQLGDSRGTEDMIRRATGKGLYIYWLKLPDLPYLHAERP